MKKNNLVLIVMIVVLVFILPVLVAADNGAIPNFGAYPEYGDGFLYLAGGGHAELAHSDVNDIDYSSTSFSVEAIVDTRSLFNSDWTGILGKGRPSSLLYNGDNAGWALGFSRSVHQTLNHGIQAKVGDGTNQVALSQTVSGVNYVVMTWDRTTRTLELFVNGESAGTKSNADIVLANIGNSYELFIGNGNSEIKRNVLMARWWGRKLSNSDISALYNNWNNNGDDRVPDSVSRNNLVSEWLMDEEVDASGTSGNGYIKDNAGSNHLQMTGNAELKISSGESLTMIYPADGAIGVDKTVTLKASGGDADVGTHPLSYFFQVDTSSNYNSQNLKESGWLAHYAEYRAFLSSNTKYYWRVKVKAADGSESSYTSIRSFTTEGPTTWYVRPAGQSYGAGDGTNYKDAWDDLRNVKFGETGVEPGDTLSVCGLHYHTVTQDGYIASQGGILVLNGRQYSDSTERITIDGECPEGEPGIVWGAYKMFDEPWVNEGSNVYSIHLDGCAHPGNMFQDVGLGGNNDYTLLDPASSVAECGANPGSYFISEGHCRGNLFYVHTTDSNDPTGRIWANRYGYQFKVLDNKYITFKNLKLMASGSGISSAYPTEYIRWENNVMMHGEHGLLDFWDGHNNMEIINNELAWASNGIYLISSTNNAPSNFLIKGNYIHDLGILPYHINGDAHAVGTQGANNLIIEDNYIERTGNPILLYTFTRQDSKNNIIRRNIVKDCHTMGSTHGYGIATQTNNDALTNHSGIKIYQNIVSNCTHCFRFQFEDDHELYNNIAHNCGEGLATGRNYQGYGAQIKFRNNIFYDIDGYYINWYSGATDHYLIDSDYNLFYPAEGDVFRHAVAGGDMTFDEWQTHTASSCPNCLFDPNSFVLDPMFVDPENGDFRLQPGSPAIDMGIDVGFITDLEGSPVPQGIGPDVGPFESSNTGGCVVDGDVSGDCKVDFIDLIMVARDFGKTSGYNSLADTDGNNVIDIFDIVYVARRIV